MRSIRDPERGGPLGAVVTGLRSALWPLPVLAIVVAVALGFALPALDHHLQDAGRAISFGFGGGPSAARALLSAIATSLISVTALVFSLTVVALQLSSSQYTPRLLQTFVADRVVQTTLAQLVLTFVYALTVLRAVRSRDEALGVAAFVPGTAVTLASLLTLGSVLAVVLFLGHLARSLRVETLLRDVHQEARATLRRQGREDDEGRPEEDEPVAAGAVPLPASSSGFLVAIEEREIVAAARAAGVRVRLATRIGDDMIAGTPVAHAWPRPDAEAAEELRQALGRALVLRYERQASRDVVYSLRKIVDVVVRSLSPGINDPTTAVHGLSHAAALLGDLVERPRRPRCHRDDDGVVRLVVREWQPAELLDLVVEEPLQFAEGQPAVLRRLAGLLREVAWRAPCERLRGELVRHSDRLCALAVDSTGIQATEVARWRRELEDALDGRWPPETG